MSCALKKFNNLCKFLQLKGEGVGIETLVSPLQALALDFTNSKQRLKGDFRWAAAILSYGQEDHTRRAEAVLKKENTFFPLSSTPNDQMALHGQF